MKFFALILVLIGSTSWATPRYGVFYLHELWIEYGRYYDGSRIAEMPEHRPKESLGLNMELRTLWNWVTWRNYVHAVTDDGQYRMVGWKSWLGVRIPAWDPWVEMGHRHHSQHVLEGRHPLMKFPSEDAFYMRVYVRF